MEMDMAKFRERFKIMPAKGKTETLVYGQADSGLNAKVTYLESRVRELEDALKAKDAQLTLALEMWAKKDEKQHQAASEKARGGTRLKVFAGQEARNVNGSDTRELGGTGAQAQEHGRTPDEGKPGGSPQDGGRTDQAPVQGGVQPEVKAV